jgi:hypothetical protein
VGDVSGFLQSKTKGKPLERDEMEAGTKGPVKQAMRLMADLAIRALRRDRKEDGDGD